MSFKYILTSNLFCENRRSDYVLKYTSDQPKQFSVTGYSRGIATKQLFAVWAECLWPL